MPKRCLVTSLEISLDQSDLMIIFKNSQNVKKTQKCFKISKMPKICLFEIATKLSLFVPKNSQNLAIQYLHLVTLPLILSSRSLVRSPDLAHSEKKARPEIFCEDFKERKLEFQSLQSIHHELI